ncbi:hypothetical protein Q8A67_024146 [Cirrhinus molitorella]|uniref:Uncharacterized protein n=1 Tax=Cirrhinus molitorella TaxID=172907 RepID=A0AA88P444_9TELE|nr:hypothetical protein Q8A67_024146 [Cirrhinus molitorella]
MSAKMRDSYAWLGLRAALSQSPAWPLSRRSLSSTTLGFLLQGMAPPSCVSVFGRVSDRDWSGTRVLLWHPPSEGKSPVNYGSREASPEPNSSAGKAHEHHP